MGKVVINLCTKPDWVHCAHWTSHGYHCPPHVDLVWFKESRTLFTCTRSEQTVQGTAQDVPEWSRAKLKMYQVWVQWSKAQLKMYHLSQAVQGTVQDVPGPIQAVQGALTSLQCDLCHIEGKKVGDFGTYRRWTKMDNTGITRCTLLRIFQIWWSQIDTFPN